MAPNPGMRLARQTGDELALLLGLRRSTVVRALHKWNFSRLASLEPKPPVQRYEQARPRDMLHVEIKRLGKIDEIGRLKAGPRRYNGGVLGIPPCLRG